MRSIIGSPLADCRVSDNQTTGGKAAATPSRIYKCGDNRYRDYTLAHSAPMDSRVLLRSRENDGDIHPRLN